MTDTPAVAPAAHRLIADLPDLLPAYAEPMPARVAGTVTAVAPRRTPQHQPWAVLDLVDDSGRLRVMVFPRVWEACGPIHPGARLEVTGRVFAASDGVEMQASRLADLLAAAG